MVGDLEGNVRRIVAWLDRARQVQADIVVFPELALTGYPPDDLLLKPRFLIDTKRALDDVARHCDGVAAVIGFVAKSDLPLDSSATQRVVSSTWQPSASASKHVLYNAAAFVADQRIASTYAKIYLPNYGVFDEGRYFHQGNRALVVVFKGVRYGLSICEDIWFPEGPAKALVSRGKAEVILNINASPFHMGKSRNREELLADAARRNQVIITYTNTVGGQDEVVFDGNSVVMDHDGQVIRRGKAFEEDLVVVDLDVDAVTRSRSATTGQRSRRLHPTVTTVVVSRKSRTTPRAPVEGSLVPRLDTLEETYRALLLGIRDYVHKNGFHGVLIGLSGGIDSALTAVLATEALGADYVSALFMPSPFTSRVSEIDVYDLVRRLGITVWTIPITGIVEHYGSALEQVFQGKERDTTEENLQARTRGNLLMAVSNKFGHLVLATGNKSELSVGYATLYGDMAGGFAVIKDVPKTVVYELASWRNRQHQEATGESLIPTRIIERPPSAELKEDQTDQDTLPPYHILDPILQAYIEEDQGFEDIVARGFPPDVVAKVITMVDHSEYKRRQAPIGVKITHRAFGRDRRMPITNGYRPAPNLRDLARSTEESSRAAGEQG